MKVEKYSKLLANEWDSLIDNAKNGTFLLKRDFISYHEARFDEVSLVVYDEKKVIAVLPLSKNSNTVISYGGLTYGGLIYHREIKINQVLDAWNVCLDYLKREFISLKVKLVPNHYTLLPSEETFYAMFLIGATISRIDTAFVIDRNNYLPYQKRRRRSIKKADRLGYVIKYDDDFDCFWNEILSPNLKQKHGVDPVHSLEEILMLKKRFYNQIIQVNIYHDETMVAGTTLFLTNTTIHAQYISGNDFGKSNGFLDLLFDDIIGNFSKSHRYFDFGISNECEGRLLNQGLTDWKESYGARTICHFFYDINLNEI